MFIQQMLQQGIIELDYKDHYSLKLNRQSKNILFEGRKVKLVSPQVICERQNKKEKATAPKQNKAQIAQHKLFEELRRFRKQIADQMGKPAFAVFSDNSLYDMVDRLPGTCDEFLEVEGVGEYKAEQYANIFLKTIARFLSGNNNTDTYKTTWTMYNQGMKVKQIVEERNLQPTTIYSHIAKLITADYEINLFDLIKEKEFMKVKKAVDQLGMEEKLKTYFEFLEGELDYGKIRVGLSYLELG